MFAHPSVEPATDPDCHTIDGLIVRGNVLAWSSSATGQGGLYHTETKEELLRIAGLTWISHPAVKAPLIGLTKDARSIVYRKRGAPAQCEIKGGLWKHPPQVMYGLRP